jgi:hypothetical protein
MTNIELHVGFLRGINRFGTIDRPSTKAIEQWLNRGLDKYFTTRYTGFNVKQQGFEQSQKRIDDLQTCMRHTTLTSNATISPYTFALPSDYVFLVSDTCEISPTDGSSQLECWPKDADGKPIPKQTITLEHTHDTLGQALLNTLSEHRFMFGKAKPLRVIHDGYIRLHTDGTYKPSSYSIWYLTKPTPINIHSNFTSEYLGMPKHTHPEILQIAITLFLAATGGETINAQSAMEQSME